MPESKSDASLDVRGLVLVPAVLTLGITLLRLAGELAHWSHRLFNPAAGGGGAIVGISWLPFIFGPYFALKLTRSGKGAASLGKAFGSLGLGIVLFILGGFVAFRLRFPGKEFIEYLLMALAASMVNWGWPALFKVLIAYGYAARIPVAILMFFAIRGHWGTHYDALPPGYSSPGSFSAAYWEIAFLPQMIFWPVMTVLVGTLLGLLVVSVRGLFHAPAA